jgi:hypothetical protein
VILDTVVSRVYSGFCLLCNENTIFHNIVNHMSFNLIPLVFSPAENICCVVFSLLVTFIVLPTSPSKYLDMPLYTLIIYSILNATYTYFSESCF